MLNSYAGSGGGINDGPAFLKRDRHPIFVS